MGKKIDFWYFHVYEGTAEGPVDVTRDVAPTYSAENQAEVIAMAAGYRNGLETYGGWLQIENSPTYLGGSKAILQKGDAVLVLLVRPLQEMRKKP